MSLLSVDLIGPFHLSLDFAPVTALTSPKIQALVAYLTIESTHAHARDFLAALLWPEHAAQKAQQNLRQSLRRLQQALPQPAEDEPFFTITRHEVGFNRACRHTLDWATFVHAIEQSRTHAHGDVIHCDQCCTQLAAAVERYRGDLLGGVHAESPPFDEWLHPKREWLRREALVVLGLLTRHYAWKEDLTAAYRMSWRQIEIDPLAEDAHRWIMQILAQDGRSSEALEHYERLVARLAADVDGLPAQETIDLYEAIRRGGYGSKRRLRTLSPPTPTLPPQFTPFVGRYAERRQIAQRLAQPECRLLTLLGPGGVGKSRLAVQVAQECAHDYADGVAFVALAPVDSHHQVVTAVAAALGIGFSPRAASLAKRQSELLAQLRTRHLLLILDNLEHLLPTTAQTANTLIDLIIDILHKTPHVQILATSRRSLDLHAEWILNLGGLGYQATGSSNFAPKESDDSAAVHCFVENVRRTQPDFVLDEATLPAVLRLCSLVDGLPLALELAAAQTKISPIQAVVDRIAADLDSLATTMRDRAPRHSSLRAVFNSSWTLLAPEDRRILARLSTLKNEFSAAAALAIADAGREKLDALAARSLIHRADEAAVTVNADGEPRYAIHSVLAHYAAEKLAADTQEETSAHRAHCRYFSGLLAQCSEWMDGDRLLDATHVIRHSFDDIRAAWRWASAQIDLDAIARSEDALLRYFVLTNQCEEGQTFFACALAALREYLAQQQTVHPVHEGLLATLITDLARMLQKWGRYDEAMNLAQEAVEVAQRIAASSVLPRAQLYLALTYLYRDHVDEARAWLNTALASARAIGHEKLEADALRGLGILADSQDDLQRAAFYYEASYVITQRIGDLRGSSASIGNLGSIDRRLGNFQRAEERLLASLRIHEQIGDDSSAGRTYAYLADIAADRQDLARARDYSSLACLLLEQVRDRYHEAATREQLAAILQQMGDSAAAQLALQRALTIYTDFQDNERAARIQAKIGA